MIPVVLAALEIIGVACTAWAEYSFLHTEYKNMQECRNKTGNDLKSCKIDAYVKTTQTNGLNVVASVLTSFIPEVKPAGKAIAKPLIKGVAKLLGSFEAGNFLQSFEKAAIEAGLTIDDEIEGLILISQDVYKYKPFLDDYGYVNWKTGIIDTYNKAKDPNNQYAYDPLILDLNGDGIKTTTLENGVYFDQSVGWVLTHK